MWRMDENGGYVIFLFLITTFPHAKVLKPRTCNPKPEGGNWTKIYSKCIQEVQKGLIAL